MRLDLDTEIRFPTGERAGVLRRVLMDENDEVTSIVMATEDFISREVIVPIDMLHEDPGGVITIDVAPNDVIDLPDYEEEEVPMVPQGWEMSEDPAPGGEVFPATMYQPIVPIAEVPFSEGEVLEEGEVSLSQGTEIWCLDGSWGVVDEVLTDDSGNVYAFVGRSDDAYKHDRVLPMDLVQSVDQGRVTLNCTLDDLPTYTQELVDEQEEPEV